MSMSTQRTDREFDKFVQAPDGSTAVRVIYGSGVALGSGGINGAKTVTATPVLASVNAGNKTSRYALIVHPIGDGVFWGFSSGVTVSNGLPLNDNSPALFLIDSTVNVDIYLVSSGSVDVRIAEV